MKKRIRWMAGLSALALTALCAGGAMAASGDKNDPLVTLSYLEETVLPDLLGQVEKKTADRQKELDKNFQDKIDGYKKEVAGLAGSGGEAGASYTLVTLTSGQTMYLEVGCELMLRVGTATVNSGTNPALVDISTGGTVNSGTALIKNHLYMSTIPDRTIKPTAATVKLLVRGGYVVK